MNIIWIQAIVDGLLLGAIYALAALGVSLIFGVMNRANFSQGALTMLSMYITWEFCSLFGISPYVALPLTAAIMFGIGYLIQRCLINRISKAASHNQLLMTIGISIIVQNAALMIWSANAKVINIPGFEVGISVLGLTVSKPKLAAFLCVAVVACILYGILNKTELGRAIRGASMSHEGAALVGIRIEVINAIAFGLGIGCAGIAGALFTPILYLSPTIGDSFQLKCFVISVLGGMGNVWGALVGGLLVGVVSSIGSFVFGGSWADLLVYVIFVLTLLVKPTGLFGRSVSRA